MYVRAWPGAGVVLEIPEALTDNAKRFLKSCLQEDYRKVRCSTHTHKHTHTMWQGTVLESHLVGCLMVWLPLMSCGARGSIESSSCPLHTRNWCQVNCGGLESASHSCMHLVLGSARRQAGCSRAHWCSISRRIIWQPYQPTYSTRIPAAYPLA